MNDSRPPSNRLQNRLKKAFEDKNWSLFNYLLGRGANINHQYGTFGETLLFNCITSSEIKKLIELGADVNAKDNFGTSVLGHATVNCRSIDSIRTLLKCGADVNAPTQQGSYSYSPLTFAAKHRQYIGVDIIKLMMEYRGDIKGPPVRNAPRVWLGDDDCSQILIKYAVLYNQERDCGNIIELNQQRFDNILECMKAKTFLAKCVREVALMREMKLNEKTTLYEFLTVSKNRRVLIKTPIDSSNFSIYKDIVQEAFERWTYRQDLAKKLGTGCIYARSGRRIIKLDYDSTLEVADYLDDEDLESSVKAFVR